MESERIDLTISIVNTSNKNLLDPCLRSIYENTERIRFEIIVVDNCSDDGSVEMVREKYPDVRLICQTSRQGYGYSHNRAWEQSRGEYFLVFNEDMLVLSNALDSMTETIKSDPSIGALGCRLLNPDKTLQNSCSYFPTLTQAAFESVFPHSLIMPKSRYRQQMFFFDHNEERDVEVILGACMLIPRKVIEEVGLFDERFFIYSEEVDLCKRIRDAGWKTHFSPRGEVIHYGGQTSKTMRLRFSILFLESKLKYFAKHYGPVKSEILRILFIVRLLLRIVGKAVGIVVWPVRADIRVKNLTVTIKCLLWLLRVLPQ